MSINVVSDDVIYCDKVQLKLTTGDSKEGVPLYAVIEASNPTIKVTDLTGKEHVASVYNVGVNPTYNRPFDTFDSHIFVCTADWIKREDQTSLEYNLKDAYGWYKCMIETLEEFNSQDLTKLVQEEPLSKAKFIERLRENESVFVPMPYHKKEECLYEHDYPFYVIIMAQEVLKHTKYKIEDLLERQ